MTPRIRILELDSNRHGDLFGRLMADLCLALGYDQPRLNIHKSGREIDIEAEHRAERRCMIAECKAEADPIGGGEVNKFVGSLDAEKRKRRRRSTVGYFISVSGFRESAIEQEKDLGNKRLVLFDGKRVVEELVRGRVVVSLERAMERAGRCASSQADELMPQRACELLAHDSGWIWALYFTTHGEVTHFALVHADGEPLGANLADCIVSSDQSCGGRLHTLTYLPPRTEASVSEESIQRARAKYFGYLAAECGEIQLEGLPADEQIGSRKLNLEKIFVPLYLEATDGGERRASASDPGESNRALGEPGRRPVGTVLSEQTRLAVLATPGGGKSTLLKRLAIAYAFPERRALLDDMLPDRSWLPVFIRCRQLDDAVSSPIRAIIDRISERAEMPELSQSFSSLISGALHSGNVLLLIDGLDEITHDGDRVAFALQLRAFLATYPKVSIVVTSREAGFRIVGRALSSQCVHYKLADLDDPDIERLVLAWHREVIGDREEVRLEAERLSSTICSSDRIRQLAQNPLLLTTLLLVKRWVGQLPTRRTVLYGKAIEVLLMTWNVEAHEPLDQDEVIPQLAFLAFTMMSRGTQRISRKGLHETLALARSQMPEVLAYAKLNETELIEQVELRSSLLMLTGHEIEDGTLQPVYEFRHLTFQEYLAAVAVVEGYYPDRGETDTPLTSLEAHLDDEQWKEVVPLAAVLAGRNSHSLVRRIIDVCKAIPSGDDALPRVPTPALSLLAQCIIDEVQIPPEIVEEALETIARRDRGPSPLVPLVYRSKYANTLHDLVRRTFMSSSTDMGSLGSALAEITLEQLHWYDNEATTPPAVNSLLLLLDGPDPADRAVGALGIMELAFSAVHKTLSGKDCLRAAAEHLRHALDSDIPQVHFACSWAFAWLGESGLWSPVDNPSVLPRLLEIWRNSSLLSIQRQSAWAIAHSPVFDRSIKLLPEPDADVIQFLKEQAGIEVDGGGPRSRFKRRAAWLLAFYWRKPWTDEELANLIEATETERDNWRDKLLSCLGEPGASILSHKQRKRRPQGKANGTT